MSIADTSVSPAGSRRVFAVIAGLLVIWALALWLYNSLFFKFANFFSFGPIAIASTLAAFHIAYVAMAFPAVMFHRQFGYKLGLLAGLSVFGIGAFLLYLAILNHHAAYLVAAALVIGACGAWLDTALNPLAALCGDRKSVFIRMNIAHLFSGAGLVGAYAIGISLLGKDYQLSSASAQVSARPYVLIGLGAILLAFLLEQIRLPDFAAKGKKVRSGELKSEMRALIRNPGFAAAALALGCYTAVLTVMWTASYKYAHTEMPGHVVQIFERGWVWFVAGRLLGALAMRWVAPLRLLWVSAACCAVAIALAGLGGVTGWVALIASGFFLAINLPTLWGAGLQAGWTKMAGAACLLAVAAGAGNALSSLLSSTALDALQIAPRLVVLGALPFQAFMLAYAIKTARSPALD